MGRSPFVHLTGSFSREIVHVWEGHDRREFLLSGTALYYKTRMNILLDMIELQYVAWRDAVTLEGGEPCPDLEDWLYNEESSRVDRGVSSTSRG
jgi:hypothetical protein